MTDHKPLISIFSPVKGFPQFSANRLRRWAAILSGFSYTIEHVKSQENLADAWSRLPIDKLESKENEIPLDVDFSNYFTDTKIPINFEIIRNETLRDKF